MYAEPANYQDVDKYFRNCFIKVAEYGDTLFFIEKVTPEGIFGQDEHGEPVCVEFDGKELGKVGYHLDYIIPKKAFFQVKDKAVLLGRIPARMWKKGISKENTCFYVFGERITTIDVGFEILKAYVQKPIYLPYTELKDKVSLALSPRVALHKNGFIFVDSTKVGRYYDSSKTIICKKLFLNDLKPLFPGIKFAKG